MEGYWINVVLTMQGLLKDAEVIYYYHKEAEKAIKLADRGIFLYEQNAKELSELSAAKDLYKKLLNFAGNVYVDLKDERFKDYIDKFFNT